MKRSLLKGNVNVKKEDKKLKEAELLNQQTPAEEVPAPQPAAPEEVAAAQQEVAAPVAEPAPVEQPVEETPVEEPAVEVDGDEVEIPATVEIKTQDLSQAIAMATGDVEPAETGVDMEAKKAQEEPLVQEPEMPADPEQPMTEAVSSETEAAEACAQAKPEGERKIEDPESEPTGVSKEDYNIPKNNNGIEKIVPSSADPFKESLTEEEKNLILEYRKYKETAETAPAEAELEQPSAENSNEEVPVVKAIEVKDISDIDNIEDNCEACNAAEAAAPIEEAAEPKGKTVDGAINAEGYQDEKLNESKYVIYCEDPDKSAFSGMTGYVGNDSNWGSIEALLEHDPEAVFDSKEAAQELIDTDPSFELHKEDGVKYSVVEIDEAKEEAPKAEGWIGLQGWINDMKREIANGAGPEGNALKFYKMLKPIVAMKNVKRLDDLYYNMYDEIEDFGGREIGLISDIEAILNEVHPIDESCKIKEAADYFYLDDGNEVLCDEDGNTLKFDSPEEARDYAEEHGCEKCKVSRRRKSFDESKMKEAVEDEVIEDAPIDLVSDAVVEEAPMVTDIPAFGEDEEEVEEDVNFDDVSDSDIDSFVADEDIEGDYDPQEAAGIDAMLQNVEDEAVATIDSAKAEVKDTADKLQNSADFLKSLTDNGEEFMDMESTDVEDGLEECVERIPVSIPKKSIKEAIEAEEPLVVDEAAIVFPAGSREEDSIEEENLVKAYEARVKAKREAIAEFRESVRRKNEAEAERFNEALKSSVKKEDAKLEENNNSWASNRFYEKYEERQKLDFKQLRSLLNNGFLG